MIENIYYLFRKSEKILMQDKKFILITKKFDMYIKIVHKTNFERIFHTKKSERVE